MHFSFCLLHASTRLLFLIIPPTEVFQDSLCRYVAVPATPGRKMPDSCGLFRSPSPAGDQLAGHAFKVAADAKLAPDSSAVTFSFTPLDRDTAAKAPTLALGTHFLVAACGDSDVTPELPIRVVTRQAPTFLSPKAQEPSASPAISWTPVPGVPAYHVLLSDQPIKIDPVKGSVDGASVIWQAITTQTSIAYGTPDPSGNFAGIPAPPLSPGVLYNLVLLNNYDGRSALASSAKAQSLKLFSIVASGPALAKPVNVNPKEGQALDAAANPNLTLTWTASKSADGKAAANTYKAFIYSKETQNAVDVLVPIWQAEVTDTSVTLDAKRTLLDKTYIWKVFAVSDAGTSIVGDTTSFAYHNSVQTLSLTTRTLGGAGDTVALGDVRVDVTPLDGSADPLPLFTLETGRVDQVLATGGYALAFSKAGYVDQKSNVTLTAGAPAQVTVFLPPAPSRVTGRAVDGNGLGLDNVQVTGARGTSVTSAVTDAQGYFVLGAAPGGLAVSFAKPDYQSPPDTVVSLKAGQSLDLGRVTLAHAQASLSGVVANDKGALLSGCRIDIKTAAGLLLRTLLTDDKGGFSVFLTPGNYIVDASRTGFTSDEKMVQLSEAAQLSFVLAPGASLLKGTVTARAHPGPGISQVTPLGGALLELTDARGGVQKAQADLRGQYVFSADTGVYRLRVSAPGLALADSQAVHVAAQRSTLTQDVELTALASVQGALTLVPAAAVDPSLITVSLLLKPSLALFKSAAASRSPAPGGGLVYSLDGVPDGDYRITCGAPGYGPAVEPEVTVAGGVWLTGQDITLNQATKSLTFALSQAGQPVTGTIRLQSPQTLDLATGKKLTQAPAGTYVLDAVPDTSVILPLARYAFFLPATGAADTTVTLPLAYSHAPAPLTLHHDTADLFLKTPARFDSAFVVYGYGVPGDTLRLTAAQVASAGDSVDFRIAPGNQGGLLTYYFVVRSGAFTFSNESADRRFHAQVEPSRELAYLRLSAGDTLRLPSRSHCRVSIHAYDAAGNRLDSLVDLRGKVTFGKTPGLDVRVEGRAARVLALATGAGAAPKTAAKRAAAQTGAWDSVLVTVTLDSLSRTLKLPARVVAARINKLVLTSTLGSAPAIQSPAAFGLFLTGFDTTATPPIPLVPTPALSLDPPEAGVITEQQVTLAARFIGPVRVLARQTNDDGSSVATELGAERDSLLRGLNVGQTLAYGDSARLFVHDPQFEIAAPDSLLAGPGQAVLRMYRRGLAKSFSSRVADVVAGRVYEVSNPSGAALAKPLRLRLALPSAFRGREAAMKRFDAVHLEWKGLRDSALADVNAFGAASLSSRIDSLDNSYYALLAASKDLSAASLDILPNPFSPLVLAARDGNTQYGARLRVRPESDRSAEVTVSVSIYNLDGELVRLLVDHKTVPKAPVDFYWDGKTDGGRWARNGRYLVKLSLTATGAHETKYVLKPIVVFQ